MEAAQSGDHQAVEISEASYSWPVRGGKTGQEEEEEERGREIPTLFDINLQVARGQLVGIAGGVGAGKSSLISAILGEVRQRERERAIGVFHCYGPYGPGHS